MNSSVHQVSNDDYTAKQGNKKRPAARAENPRARIDREDQLAAELLNGNIAGKKGIFQPGDQYSGNPQQAANQIRTTEHTNRQLLQNAVAASPLDDIHGLTAIKNATSQIAETNGLHPLQRDINHLQQAAEKTPIQQRRQKDGTIDDNLLKQFEDEEGDTPMPDRGSGKSGNNTFNNAPYLPELEPETTTTSGHQCKQYVGLESNQTGRVKLNEREADTGEVDMEPNDEASNKETKTAHKDIIDAIDALDNESDTDEDDEYVISLPPGMAHGPHDSEIAAQRGATNRNPNK